MLETKEPLNRVTACIVAMLFHKSVGETLLISPGNLFPLSS